MEAILSRLLRLPDSGAAKRRRRESRILSSFAVLRRFALHGSGGSEDVKKCAPIILERVAAHFAKLWSAVATEPPLWREGDADHREDPASITRCVPSRSSALPKRWPLPPHSKVLRTKRLALHMNAKATSRRFIYASPLSTSFCASIAVVVHDSGGRTAPTTFPNDPTRSSAVSMTSKTRMSSRR